MAITGRSQATRSAVSPCSLRWPGSCATSFRCSALERLFNPVKPENLPILWFTEVDPTGSRASRQAHAREGEDAPRRAANDTAAAREGKGAAQEMPNAAAGSTLRRMAIPAIRLGRLNPSRRARAKRPSGVRFGEAVEASNGAALDRRPRMGFA